MSRLKTDAIRNVNASVDGITLDTSGNVAILNKIGINTTSPEDLLHIKTGKIRIENAIVSNNDSTISYDNDTFLVDVDPNNVRGSSQFQIKIDTVSGLIIDDNRRVGIGITSPTQKLDVAGSLQLGNGNAIGFGDQSARIIGESGASGILRFDVNGGERFRIDSSGRVLIGTTTAGFAAYGDVLTIEKSSHVGLTLRTATNKDAAIYFADSSSGGGRYAGFIDYSHGSNYLRFGTNEVEKLRITSDGQVLVNSTSVVKSHDALTVKRAAGNHSATSLTVDATTATGSYANALIFTKAKDYYYNGLVFESSSGHQGGVVGKMTAASGTTPQIELRIGGTSLNQSDKAALTIYPSGNVSLPDGNLEVASGHGIDFSANSHASGMSSELLDDYEIGAWTPLIATTGTNFTSISNSSSGHYTKVGNVVTLTMYHRTDGITKGSASNSDHVIITGLPFTPSSNIQRCFVPIGFNPNWAEYPNQALIKESSTNIELYKYASAGGYNTGTRLTVAAVATGGNANYCLVTMVYRT